MLDQNLLKNHLYNTFVLLQVIKQNDMIHDTEVEVHDEIIPTTEITVHKTDTALHLEIILVIELLKSLVVVSFRRVRTDIRSLRF